MKKIARILNSILPASLRWGYKYNYDTLPPEKIRAAATLPYVKEHLTSFSLQEYDRNPYYQIVIENLANHTIGTATSILGVSQKVQEQDNDFVEDSYQVWTSNNRIGFAYRDIRRQAALTGIGIGIPYKDLSLDSLVSLSYKVYNGASLKSPANSSYQDRIYNGIEYDENWEPRTFFIQDQDDLLRQGGDDVKDYAATEIIYWSRTYNNGVLWPIPECYAAFTYYPFIRRYIQAVLEAEEFNASFPMAVELDPKVYSAYSQEQSDATPTGQFEYKPRMVPTLRPGMKLSGIPHNVSAGDRKEIMQTFASTCALTVQMPKNLALGDSSNSNMASAQVDIQPWANKVSIDRFDMEPMFRKSFKQWWDVAVRREMPARIRNVHLLYFPHKYVYPDLFEHPDPNKRANARAVDLTSGAITLNRLYSSRGLNFRREMRREAEALGISTQDLISIYLSGRNTNAIKFLEQGEEYAKED